MRTRSQCDAIAAWLEANGSITPLKALELCGCMRLAARVSDLRARGMPIETVRESRNGSCYARYVLRKDGE